ncbi:MAG: ABC transporter ATP-binding protein [Clostridia bacterium]|nr:ABC transporter ATP-binding protein [Clostridia bacterium]
MNDIFLSVKDVKRSFPTASGEFWALKGVSAEIPRGKLTILKGRSGSGKTTLLNILGALDKPTEGDVLFDGKSIVSMSEHKRAQLRRREVGFVFQSVALIPMMNALENVQYALRMARSREKQLDRAMECLKMVGLGARVQHMPQELSGGEQQRVAIARAIAHRPKIIFADEPTGELDTVTGLQVVKIFKELCEREGVTIVMTTHDTGLMEIGDAVIELEDGERING